MLKLLPALLIAAFTAVPLVAGAADAKAAVPATLPASYFFKNPDVGTAALSPSGRYLATTTRKLGALQLAVLDLETNAAQVVAGYEDMDIVSIQWIDDERIAYSLLDRSAANATYAGLHTVTRSGGKPVPMTWTARDRSEPVNDNTIAGIELLRPARDGRLWLAQGYILAGGDARPLLVDPASGRRTEIPFKLPGKPLDFMFDAKDEVRAAVTATGEDLQTQQVWYRDPGSATWRMLASYATYDPVFSVVGMVGDTLYVSAPAGAHAGLYKYDTVNNKPGELVLADADADVGGPLIVARDTGALLGVHIGAEPPRIHWFDAGYAALQKAVDRAHPEQLNRIMPNAGNAPRLILSYSSTDPGRLLRYVPETKKLSTLFSFMPWIEPAKMAEKLVFDYQARDGLALMAYLTLPPGRTPRKLPLIVLPHGGPHMRDYYNFDPQVQFLANRGYAVLQPQFRGSIGFGVEHLKKGYRQWGLSMQDDLTDGLRALAAQGVADPKRVCIMGTSYGGYAAMMGLAKDPDLYRCGINLLGVTNLTDLVKSGRWEGEAARHHHKIRLGDLATMKEQLERTSPANRAADIQAPVYMAYGEKDRRVPLSHGTGMRDALNKAGKPVEWVSFRNEEHGFAHEDNRVRLHEGIDAFLRKHNPAD